MPKLTPSALCLALTTCAFGLTLALYGRLPDPMPTHWSSAGRADGFTPKPLGPFILPLCMALAQLSFVALRGMSPRTFATPSQSRAVGLIQLSIVGFLFVITGASLAAGLGTPVPWNRVLSVALGPFVIALGLAMRSLQRNAFVGIRTRWTMADDEVWRRTHVMGGRMFVGVGLLALVGGSLGLGPMPILIALGLAALAPALYSWRVHRQLQGPQAKRPGR